MEEKIQEREKSKKQTPLMDLWKRERELFISSIRVLIDESNSNPWFRNEDSFQYLKQIIAENRLFIISGTWDGKKTLPSIGQAFSDINLPIRMLYLGQIHDGWKTSSMNKKTKNLLTLPFDNQSRVFHTTHEDFHAIDGLTFQRRLKRTSTGIWFDSIPSDIPGVFITGVIENSQ